MRAVALIDGEHSPDVVREALRELPYEWVGAILVGGTEKLREGESYGVPLLDGFGGAELVVDLSDAPVLGPAERFGWASRALAAGLPYLGAGFRFDPPVYEELSVPSIAVIGTGKRVGKTAVSAHLARLLARDRAVVVVTMGRGGPAEPEVLESPPRLDALLALSRQGRHAASDHFEIAVVSGVPRSAAAAPAEASPGSRSSRTSARARASLRSDGPISSSSTAAARRSRPSPPTGASS